MQVSLPSEKPYSLPWQRVGWCLLGLLAVLLCLPEMKDLWTSWRSDPSLSHGPLIPFLTLGHLWIRRDKLRRWEAASLPGLLLLLFATFLYIAAVWADIDFLKPLSLIGMLLGGFWFVGGPEILRASAGALGMLVFMIPWPTTLVDRLAFPLQLTSSAYAALFAGMLGVPVHREGVHMFVMPNPDARPIYSIVVAQQCSGLTSLMVLLVLGYLIAYHTPLKWGFRALLVGVIVPLTLLTNAIRLTIILFAGAHGSPALAQWLHDHEGPVLIFCCSLGLMALRHALLTWTQSRSPEEGKAVVSIPSSDPERTAPAGPAG
jgi:exosortase